MFCSSLIHCCSPVVPLTRFLAQRDQKPVRRRQAPEQAPGQQQQRQDSLDKEQPLSRSGSAVKPVQRDKEMSKLRPPRKLDRKRGRASPKEAPTDAMEESIQEQLSSVAARDSNKHNSASSIAEAVSELPEATASLIRTDVPSPPDTDYAQDTFESLDSTLTPPPSHHVATSTPTPASEEDPLVRPPPGVGPPGSEDYTLSESLRLSESISGERSAQLMHSLPVLNNNRPFSVYCVLCMGGSYI